jgi:SAM-dependent methyltransferase
MPQLNQKVWDTHYTRSRSQQQYPDENVVRTLKKLFTQQTRGATALDLGTGSGRHLQLISEHYEHVVAADYSRTALSQPRTGDDLRLRLRLQLALPNLPFAGSTFDFILCWGVLHYLPAIDIAPAVAAIRHILKPGSSVFLTLRSDQDTHLAMQTTEGDLQQGTANLFSREQAQSLFHEFKSFQYGFISRQPLGEEYLVAHHMICAQK